jgi:ectoine hydroxylase-related dioxygenase (phytanoyl-CoA dioxygenase family)
MQDGIIQERSIPNELLGPLKEYSGSLDDGADFQRCLAEDGYLLMRAALNADEVLTARAEVFGRLHDVGEITSPAVEGIATGGSRRREIVGDLGEFWQSVSKGAALRHVSHGSRLREILSAILGETARPHDLMYLRPTAPGRSTALHYDYPFFAGRSERILTTWIPLGDVPVCEGPLVLVEGSNRFFDLVDPIRNVDYTADRSNAVVQQAAYDGQNKTDPLTLVRDRSTRLLTADFQAGDLVVFSGFTMHGSLDNHSPPGRVRLSVDVRFQPAADPADDERYFGLHPTGSKGGGYGDMRGAKPLGE